jgi:hypothetical protein
VTGVGNLTKKKSCVSLHFPPAYEYRKRIECSEVEIMT